MEKILDIPEEYFAREDRDGHVVEPVMKRIWAASMELLATFDKGLKALGIPYFAAYGTMLGAVRHKGFIPWDNDIDIFLFRRDLTNVGKLMQLILPELTLITCENTIDWQNVSARLVTGDAIRLDDEYLTKYHGCPFAVGIDIFPLDTIPEDPDEWNTQKDIVMMVASAYTAYFLNNETPVMLTKRRQQIEETLGVTFNNETPMTHQLLVVLDAVLAINEDHYDSHLVGDIYKVTYTNPVYRKEIFSDVIRIPFENVMEVSVPAGYDEFLKQHYGEGYMTPVEWKGYTDNHPFMQQIDILKENGYALDADSGLFYKS